MKICLTIIVSTLVWLSPNLVCWLTLLKLTSHVILVTMETILVGNYEFLSYQNVCIYKMAWCNANTIARVLNHACTCISLERVGLQHSDKVCGVCITNMGIELWVQIYNTGDSLCEYYHILVHIFLNIAAIQIQHTLLEC